MDYVAKINAAILAFKLMDQSEVAEIKAGITKQLLDDDNDVFMKLLDIYSDRTLSAEGLKKPDTFRAVDRRERLTNYVELTSGIRRRREENRQVTGEVLSFILRHVDEEEWDMYYNLLSKKQGLLFTAEPLLADVPHRTKQAAKKKTNTRTQK